MENTENEGKTPLDIAGAAGANAAAPNAAAPLQSPAEQTNPQPPAVSSTSPSTTPPPQSPASETLIQPSASLTDPTTGIIDPIAPRKIVSSADLAPPDPKTPSFITPPSPAQAPKPDDGDIIINRGGRPSGPNKKVLIGVLAGVTALVVIGSILFAALAKSPSGSAKELVQANAATIETVENLLERIQLREVVTSDIMDAATHEELARAISQFLTFEAKFAKIDATKVTPSARENLKQLQSTFARQAKNLKPALELYNISYMIYSTDDSEPIKPYLESENPTVAAVAERLKEYVEHKGQLTNDLEAKKCSLMATEQSEVCAALVEEYDAVVDTMRWSFAVPQAIFFAYDTNMNDADAVAANYEEVVATTPRVKQTIEELK